MYDTTNIFKIVAYAGRNKELLSSLHEAYTFMCHASER